MKISQSVIDPFGYTGMPLVVVPDEMDALAEFVIPLGHEPEGTKEALRRMLSKLFNVVRKYDTKLSPEFVEDALRNHGAKECSVRVTENSLHVIYHASFTYTQGGVKMGRYRYAFMDEK